MNGSLERQNRTVSQGLKKQEGVVTEFTEHLWYFLADHAVIYSKEDVRFIFKNGMEIQV